jgi:hypothetical protein
MPEYVVRKVVVEVEITVKGAESEGDAVNQAVDPVKKAIPGVKILSVRVARQ